MKKFLLALVFIGFAAGVVYGTQVSMVCGQGVLLKNDGSVMIDGWKQYPNAIFPNPPNAPIPPSEWKDGPVRVTFGLSLIDTTPICWETKEGSKCTTMKSIRGLAK